MLASGCAALKDAVAPSAPEIERHFANYDAEHSEPGEPTPAEWPSGHLLARVPVEGGADAWAVDPGGELPPDAQTWIAFRHPSETAALDEAQERAAANYDTAAANADAVRACQREVRWLVQLGKQTEQLMALYRRAWLEEQQRAMLQQLVGAGLAALALWP